MLMKKEVIDENKRLKGQLEEKTYLYNKLSTESEYAIKELENQLEEEKNAYNQIYNRNQKAIEYMEHFSSDEICENITGIAKIVLEILKGEDK